MVKQSGSPAKHTINVRKPNFDLEKDLAHDWFDGSAFKTAFENSFSLLFPLGERAFIEAVKHFEKDIKDPKLLDEIYSFYGCLLYTSPSPRDYAESRMPSSA